VLMLTGVMRSPSICRTYLWCGKSTEQMDSSYPARLLLP